MDFHLNGIFNYSPAEGRFDELMTPDGSVRPAFAGVVRRLEMLGPEEFAGRRKCIRNVLYDNDLVSAAPHRGRTGSLDPLPLALAPGEWKKLEAGLIQRARIFNLLAADIYGERKLWRSGALPPALIHANPDFIPAVWGIKPPGGLWVHLCGAEVVRAADGTFRVTEDYFQSPEGIGGALENRLAVSRAFPAIFRELHVERLAVFFKALKDCFQELLPGRSDPRIVLLAAPPEHERRGEDAVLARYLGFQLAENDDLAVRGPDVYLKTLAGLKKIDALLRRVDDGMCDPLELRIDSGEGAAGLISAVRAGSAAAVNAIGSGVLDAPLFRACLPRIARELLGCEPLLPGARCRYLGSEAEAAEIFARPEGLIFRPAFGRKPGFDYSALTPAGQLSLMEKVRRHPEEWVAEDKIVPSSAPVWTNGGWRQADVSMRFFTVSSPGGGKVMPGGLGRFQNAKERLEGEKDIWVLSDGPVTQFSLLAPAGQPATLSRAGGDLPSRAASNLYELGRHIEAAEALARLARGIAARVADQPVTDIPEILPLLRAGSEESDRGQIPMDAESALWSMAMKNDHSGGLQPELAEIRRLAVQLRDRISEDTWRLIHDFGTNERPEGDGAAALLPYLGRVVSGCVTFSGLAGENMTRGQGWRFQDMGRRIERAVRCLRLLRATMTESAADEQSEIQLLQALLETGDCSMTYHRRYGGRLQAAPVIDLFLCDETNPRSVAFQTQRLQEEAVFLPRGRADRMLSPLDRELLRVSTELRLADVHAMAAERDGRRPELAAWTGTYLAALERISGLLSRDYLNHIPRRGGHTVVMATEV